MLNIFVNYTPPIYILLTCITQVIIKRVISIRVENGVDPDQMASNADLGRDLGLQCFQKGINPGSEG